MFISSLSEGVETIIVDESISNTFMVIQVSLNTTVAAPLLEFRKSDKSYQQNNLPSTFSTSSIHSRGYQNLLS